MRPPSQPGSTSEAAADRIAPSANAVRARVLEYLEKRGDYGATDYEIQRDLAMGGSTQRPRRRELEQLGFIQQAQHKRPTASGRLAWVWKVSPPRETQGEFGFCRGGHVRP
jgi:hypothetical protein